MNEPNQLLHFRRQLDLTGGFELLEVWIFADRGLETLPQHVLEPAPERSEHLIPGTDFIDQSRHIPFLPESAFVAYALQASDVSFLWLVVS